MSPQAPRSTGSEEPQPGHTRCLSLPTMALQGVRGPWGKASIASLPRGQGERGLRESRWGVGKKEPAVPFLSEKAAGGTVPSPVPWVSPPRDQGTVTRAWAPAPGRLVVQCWSLPSLGSCLHCRGY